MQDWKKLGFYCAKEILENGGTALMKSIKETLKK
jgi:hydroxymethylbilane synthase